MTEKLAKSPYIKLRDGLAIRKVKQSKNWGLYLKLEGQTALQISLKTSDQAVAITKAWETYFQTKALIENGETIWQPNKRQTVKQVLEEIIEEHEKAQDLIKIEGRDGVHATQVRIWKRIVKFYDPKIKPSALDIAEIRRYMKSEAPYSNTQLTATRYCLNLLFDRCLEKKLITKDHLFDIKKIKVEKLTQQRRDHISDESFANIYALAVMLDIQQSKNEKIRHTRQMAWRYAVFLFHSGVRAGHEALGIKWSDLNYNQNDDLFCVITDGKTKNYSKNNRFVLFDHYAEISIICAANEKFKNELLGLSDKEIIRYLSKNKPNDAIFSTLHNQNPSYGKIFKRWVDLCKEKGNIAKTQDITLYSLRHSYITRAIEGEVQLSIIAKNTGTSVAMIERHYSHISVMSDTSRKALMKDKLRFLEEEKALIEKSFSMDDEIEI